jgi:hypothetical protein
MGAPGAQQQMGGMGAPKGGGGRMGAPGAQQQMGGGRMGAPAGGGRMGPPGGGRMGPPTGGGGRMGPPGAQQMGGPGAMKGGAGMEGQGQGMGEGPAAGGGGKSPIQRTHGILERAAQAVKKGGQGQDLLRQAVVHNLAARWSQRYGRPKAAMHLTLKSRQLARQAMQANQQKVAKADQSDPASETAAAEGAAPAEVEEAVTKADAVVPAAEEVAEKAAEVDSDAAAE